jgi:hypothetical protein
MGESGVVMKISEQLSSALLEFQPHGVGEVLKSLSYLAKRNHGHWKSEKQARFLLNKMDDPLFKDRAAEAWAHRKGLEGHAFGEMIDLGYGRTDPSKIRYAGVVYVVDGGGIVYKGKVKVVHPKKGQGSAYLDWGNVKDEFVRRRPPELFVDLKAELRAKVARNQPDIDLIKSIPGWETKDILMDFMRQLERGYALSLKQRAVLQKMMPERNLFLGDKENWKKLLVRFKKGVATKLIPATRQNLEDKIGKYKGSDVEREDSFSAFRKKGEKGETWGEWYADTMAPYDEALKDVRAWQFPAEREWVFRRAIWDLFSIYSRGVTPEYGVDSFEEITKQMERAIKAKKPSKKALGVLGFVARAVEGMEGAGIAQFAKKIEVGRARS